MIVPTILAVNTLLLVGLAAVGWRRRTTPGARYFSVLQFASAVWVALTVAGLSMRPGPDRVRVWGVTVAASLFVAALWVAFILEYTGRDQWLRPRRFGIAAAPLAVGAALYAVAPTGAGLGTATHQEPTTAGTLVQASIGPVGSILGLYLYGVFLVGLVVVTRTALTETRVFVGQVAALVLGTLVTVVASAARILGFVPVAGFPATQVAIGTQSLLWGYAVFSRDLLGQVPAIARIGERTVFENVDDGLLVTDERGRVIRANPQAESLFGRSTVVGAPLSSLLAEIGVDRDSLPQQFRHGGRTYYLTGSEMTDWHDDPIGSAYVLRDVTELLTHQQRLEVLNRVLRHNVRNEVTVIRGSANEIQYRASGDLAVLGTRIVEHADRLSGLAETARELEHVFDASVPDETIDLVDFVEGLVGSVAANDPDATLSVSVEPIGIRVNRAVLALVLEEAIENALDHAGPGATVEVTVRETGPDVEFLVSDDGPGIPAAELDPIRNGEETKLAHTTGLGLWLIHWGAQSLGGTVHIDTEGGTAVRLTVPSEPDTASRPTAAAEQKDRPTLSLGLDGTDVLGGD